MTPTLPKRSAVLVLAVLVLGACSGSEGAPGAGPSAPPTGYTAPRELYGAEGPKLFVMDLVSNNIGEIDQSLDFDHIVMSPDGAEVAFTRGQKSSDSLLFTAPFGDPGAATPLGDGEGGSFSPDGNLLAAERADGIVVFDLEGGAADEGTLVLEGSELDLVGWTTGERLVAQDRRGLWLAGLEEPAPDSPEKITGPALAVSPTTATVFVGGESPQFVSLDDGGTQDLQVAGTVTRAWWSPDGNTVLARLGDGPPSTLTSIDAASGQSQPVSYANHIGDDLVWMQPSGGYFLYEKVKPGRRSDLMQCNPDLECRYLISFDERVRFLGLR
jgi:hypothetical protein